MNITEQTRVGDIVKENFSTASVFTRMNIDYCCGGNRTLRVACEEAGADIGKVIRKLDHVKSANDEGFDKVQNMQADRLCDHITKTHHNYVRAQIPVITAGLDKLCNVHGSHHPELFTVRDHFWTAAANLTSHMQKEEMILFPYIRHMVFCERTKSTLLVPSFGSVTNPVQMMVSEHENEGDRFGKIREVSRDYSLPDDACDTYRATWKMLEEFEDDLHRHIHLENNILFPEAVEKEKHLLRK